MSETAYLNQRDSNLAKKGNPKSLVNDVFSIFWGIPEELKFSIRFYVSKCIWKMKSDFAMHAVKMKSRSNL